MRRRLSVVSRCLVPDVAQPLPAVPPEMSGFLAPPAYRSFISAALGRCRWPPGRYFSHFPQPRCWLHPSRIRILTPICSVLVGSIHDGTLLHSEFNTLLLITVSNSSNTPLTQLTSSFEVSLLYHNAITIETSLFQLLCC
jgi:hypothetical protein